MREKYEVYSGPIGFHVQPTGGKFKGYWVACFYYEQHGLQCPNAEREARNLCRRLNAAAKKGKVKR